MNLFRSNLTVLPVLALLARLPHVPRDVRAPRRSLRHRLAVRSTIRSNLSATLTSLFPLGRLHGEHLRVNLAGTPGAAILQTGDFQSGPLGYRVSTDRTHDRLGTTATTPISSLPHSAPPSWLRKNPSYR